MNNDDGGDDNMYFSVQIQSLRRENIMVGRAKRIHIKQDIAKDRTKF